MAVDISSFGVPSNVNLSGSINAAGNTNQSGQGFSQNAQGGNPFANYSQPQVLGAQTQQGPGGAFPQGSSQPQQRSSGNSSSNSGGGNPHINPATGQWDDNYFAQHNQPQAPDMSAFDAIINPVISNFEQLIGTQQQATQNTVSGMNTQRQNELDTANQQSSDQTAGLQSQGQQQTTAANNAIEDAKRMYSEMSQGLLARYGTTTNTGGFLTEQLGQQTGRNISQLQQGLAQHMQDIGTALNSVKATAQLAVQGINERFDTQIQTEQDNLQKYITQIRGNEAMLQSNKAQMAAQAIQKYQDTVNNLNAQREQQANQYAIAAMNAQTQLQIYGQKGQAMLSQIQAGAPNYQGIGNNLTYGPNSITNNQPVAPATQQNTGSLPFGNQQNQNIFNPQGGQ